ncbi:MAG: hypothetical protein QOH39_1290 [Verrucomicrobiota bacterium]
MIAPLPSNEAERLDALKRYEILDTGPEQAFDDITLLASQICKTEVATITFIDGGRQWFKSKVGTTTCETSRDLAFCAHGILQSETLVVESVLEDHRFSTNPLVTGEPKIRFYAGAPLVTPDGYSLGMLCVIAPVARKLSLEQGVGLRALARQVVAQLELRRSAVEVHRTNGVLEQRTRELAQALMIMRATMESTTDGILVTDDQLKIIDSNAKYIDIWKVPADVMTAGLGNKVRDLASLKFADPRGFIARIEEIRASDQDSFDLLEPKDGRILERYSKVLTVEGNEAGRVWSFRDVTQRHLAEITSRRLAAIVASTDDAIMGKDLNGIITDWNLGAERIFGYASEEMIDESIMRSLRIDRHMADGEKLPIAGGLHVVHIPGHCAGQVAFLWQGERLLIAGDVGMNILGLGDPVGFEDIEEGRRSQRKVATLRFNAAVFGHGRPIHSGASERIRSKWAR